MTNTSDSAVLPRIDETTLSTSDSPKVTLPIAQPLALAAYRASRNIMDISLLVGKQESRAKKSDALAGIIDFADHYPGSILANSLAYEGNDPNPPVRA